MVKVITSAPRRSQDVDRRALTLFLKTLDIIGGPRQLFTYRNLTWLPSLMEAAYVVTYAANGAKTAAEIAQELGLARQTVRNILAADPEKVQARLATTTTKPGTPLRTHVAGGLVKLAQQALQRAARLQVASKPGTTTTRAKTTKHATKARKAGTKTAIS